MPKRHLAGIDTYWTSFGYGPRPALMIHCALSQSGAWGPMSAKLAGALHMTAFDLPGHGRSGPWAAENTGDIQEVSAAMAAELLPPQGRVDLVGHSFGATVALRLAVDQPERIRSLSLIEPVLFAVAFADDPAAEAMYASDAAPFRKAWAAGDGAQATAAFVAQWGTGTAFADLSPAQQQGVVGAIHTIAASAPALECDVGGILPRLSGLKAPVLLIEGSATRPIVPKIMAGLARRLPQAQRAVIAGAGHMAPLTHPDQVAREILAMLASS